MKDYEVCLASKSIPGPSNDQTRCLKPAGQVCWVGSECDSGACGGGYCCSVAAVNEGCEYCDSFEGKCRARTHAEWVSMTWSKEVVAMYEKFKDEVGPSDAKAVRSHGGHDDVALQEVLREMWRAGAGVTSHRPNTVSVTTADDGLLDMVLNWWCSLQLHGIENYLIVATTPKMLGSLVNLGLRAILLEQHKIPNPEGYRITHGAPGVLVITPNKKATTPQLRWVRDVSKASATSTFNGWNERALVKARVSFALASLNVTTILHDADTVWSVDVRQELEDLQLASPYDMLGMSDVLCSGEYANGKRDINTGFLYIPPLPSVLRLYSAVTACLPTSDQNIIGYFSRGSRVASLGRLSCQDYASGSILHEAPSPQCSLSDNDTLPALQHLKRHKVMHANYLKQGSKIPVMKAMGLWFLKKSWQAQVAQLKDATAATTQSRICRRRRNGN